MSIRARPGWTENRDLRRFNLYIPRSSVKTLDKLAKREGVSRSEVIRRAISLYLDEYDVSP